MRPLKIGVMDGWRGKRGKGGCHDFYLSLGTKSSVEGDDSPREDGHFDVADKAVELNDLINVEKPEKVVDFILKPTRKVNFLTVKIVKTLPSTPRYTGVTCKSKNKKLQKAVHDRIQACFAHL